MSRAIMVQGTASGVGKSWIATGLCRLLARRGYSVAPFKAQNMSNNAAPAQGPDGWGEIGRAQAAQAEAAKRAPHVDMNPLLIKPHAEHRAQVVMLGKPVGFLDAAGYRGRREIWWEQIQGAWARLSATAEIIVIEGAGSPAEINLRRTDMVNMAMAHHADARVLLVGDIDRGGVFASLYGTVQLLDAADRARLHGLVINRFRGDPEILRPGLAPLEQLTGLPVLGVVPHRGDLRIDDEDSLDLASSTGVVDVAVLALPTVSNFTDLGPLLELPGVGVRWARRPEELGNPDLLILPGSKDTLGDLRWLGATGLDRGVRAAAARCIPVLGLCGGYQMLGLSVREAGVTQPGLGLLPVHTEMDPVKLVRPSVLRTTGAWLLPEGVEVSGYEIHQGRTAPGPTPLVTDDGAVEGLVAGTYLHGLFDAPAVVSGLVAALRRRKGLDEAPPNPARGREASYEALADHLEAHLDLTGLLP